MTPDIEARREAWRLKAQLRRQNWRARRNDLARRRARWAETKDAENAKRRARRAEKRK